MSRRTRTPKARPGLERPHTLAQCDENLRRVLAHFTYMDRWERARIADIWLDERNRATRHA